MMQLKNYMEDAVKEKLEAILPEQKEVCSCPRCKVDITAIALNSLPPRYVVQDIGYVYAKVSELTVQFSVDLTVAVMKGIETVSKHPRHG